MDIIRQLAEKVDRISVSGDLHMTTDSKGINLSVVVPPAGISFILAFITDRDDLTSSPTYGAYSWKEVVSTEKGRHKIKTNGLVGIFNGSNPAYELNGHAGISMGSSPLFNLSTIVRLYKGFTRSDGIQEYLFDTGAAPRNEANIQRVSFQTDTEIT